MIRRLSFALVLAVGCSDEPPDLGLPDKEVCLMDRFGGEYCIDVFEAARRDSTSASPGTDETSDPVSLEARLPWVDITWEGARQKCAAKGKRLCEREEWIDACDGVVGAGGTMFAYGDVVDATRCNTDGPPAEAGGSRTNCKASTNTFDQSGNVWEWTGNTLADAVARGGSFRNSQTHQCLSPEMPVVTEPARADGGRSVEVGFRCCRDR